MTPFLIRVSGLTWTSAPTKACRFKPSGFSPGKGNLSSLAVKDKGTRKDRAMKVRVLNAMATRMLFRSGRANFNAGTLTDRQLAGREPSW